MAKNLIFQKNRSFFAKLSIKFNIPTLINATPRNIADKLHIHSFDSFIKCTKLKDIENYNAVYIRDNGYVCERGQ